jgi:hypothetical protein
MLVSLIINCKETDTQGQSVLVVHCTHRELNDLLRARLSRCRITWLLPHPLSLSLQHIVSLSQSSCILSVELPNGREVGGSECGLRSQII